MEKLEIGKEINGERGGITEDETGTCRNKWR